MYSSTRPEEQEKGGAGLTRTDIDIRERRKAQNRLAQRKHRQKRSGNQENLQAKQRNHNQSPTQLANAAWLDAVEYTSLSYESGRRPQSQENLSPLQQNLALHPNNHIIQKSFDPDVLLSSNIEYEGDTWDLESQSSSSHISLIRQFEQAQDYPAQPGQYLPTNNTWAPLRINTPTDITSCSTQALSEPFAAVCTHSYAPQGGSAAVTRQAILTPNSLSNASIPSKGQILQSENCCATKSTAEHYLSSSSTSASPLSQDHDSIHRTQSRKEDSNHLKGTTTLHLAAANGHNSIIRCLLEFGAEIDATDSLGYTALHWAIKKGQKTAVAILLEKGASTKATNHEGWSPLHLAGMNGEEEIVRLLIRKGVDLNVKINSGNASI